MKIEETPIVCDMTSAPDTPAERLAEYQRLFTAALVARERVGDRVWFRFRADDGIEAWVRDLAAREKACCAFFDFRVDLVGGEVHWEAGVIDDDIAREVLAEFYALPDHVGEGVPALEFRYAERGLTFARVTPR